MELRPGTWLCNRRYRIESLLGKGGMGEVYRAYEPSLDRYCAIKRLDLSKLPTAREMETPLPRLGDPNTLPKPQAQPKRHAQRVGPTREEAKAQFEREARLLASLDHPGLPKVWNYFSRASSSYLVMELIEGEDLERLAKKGLREQDALPWIEQVMDALAYCHERAVVHRDIKPSNIIVRRENGRAYLVDFGIAKQAGSDNKTVVGARYATPGYSPPEQYSETASTDERSDIYALGATIYFVLTGIEPTHAPDRSLTREPLASLRSIVPEISPAVDVAVMRALELRPQDRFQSIAEFRSALLGQATPGKSAPQVVVQPAVIEPRKLELLPVLTAESFRKPSRCGYRWPFEFRCGSIPVYAGEKAPVGLMVASAVAPASVFVAWPSGHMRIYAAETGELRGEYHVEPEQPDTILDLASCHGAENRVCLVLIGSAMRSRPALWAIQMDGKAIPVEGEGLKDGAPEGAHHVAYYENSYYFVSESGEGACLHLLEPHQALREKIPECIRADDFLVTRSSIFVAGLSSGGEHESGCIWVKPRGKPGPWNCLAVRMGVSDNGKLRLARGPRERHIYCAYTNSNRQPVVELRDAASGRQISCFRPGGWGTMLGMDAGMNRLYVLEERDKRAVVRWYGLHWLTSQPGC